MTEPSDVDLEELVDKLRATWPDKSDAWLANWCRRAYVYLARHCD